AAHAERAIQPTAAPPETAAFVPRVISSSRVPAPSPVRDHAILFRPQRPRSVGVLPQVPRRPETRAGPGPRRLQGLEDLADAAVGLAEGAPERRRLVRSDAAPVARVLEESVQLPEGAQQLAPDRPSRARRLVRRFPGAALACAERL